MTRRTLSVARPPGLSPAHTCWCPSPACCSVRLSGAFPERHLAHETTLLWQTLAGQVCLRPVSASLSQEGGLWPVEPPGGYEEAEAGEGGLVFCIWGRSRTCVATESGLVDKAHHAASPLDPVSVGLP